MTTTPSPATGNKKISALEHYEELSVKDPDDSNDEDSDEEDSEDDGDDDDDEGDEDEGDSSDEDDGGDKKTQLRK
ncbi:hypothetical protein NW754_007089 [Fusarium falciforme]|uniref:Uncharacterized protein n=1 Tax=Fusarium falciforme TaxID=195108 RepID=A0A9W8R345_9HYPO|nr:hypothetical protein NW754_007089 [Fusarium falciforme]KAJ4184995.1 hypothetical protein NW755_008908 [Fusarium falciforme]KAJ4241643.1 hypothetical protein NW757_012087 [Fusarium falciforme]